MVGHQEMKWGRWNAYFWTKRSATDYHQIQEKGLPELWRKLRKSRRNSPKLIEVVFKACHHKRLLKFKLRHLIGGLVQEFHRWTKTTNYKRLRKIIARNKCWLHTIPLKNKCYLQRCTIIQFQPKRATANTEIRQTKHKYNSKSYSKNSTQRSPLLEIPTASLCLQKESRWLPSALSSLKCRCTLPTVFLRCCQI